MTIYNVLRPATMAAMLLATAVAVSGCGPTKTQTAASAGTAQPVSSSVGTHEPNQARAHEAESRARQQAAARQAAAAAADDAAATPSPPESATKPARNPAAKAPGIPATKPASKPAAKAPARSAPKTAPKPAAKAPAKPAAKPAPNPAPKPAPESVKKFTHGTAGSCTGDGPWKVTWTAHFTDGSTRKMTGEMWGYPEGNITFEGKTFYLAWNCP